MSEATVKETRRQIRRALGPQGLQAVNRVALVTHHDVLPRIGSLEDRLAALAQELETQQARQGRTDKEHSRFVAMTFRERVHWFFTGYR